MAFPANSETAAPPVTGRDSLNLKLKLRQRSVVKKVNSIDWKKGSEAPLVVELDPTTACNLACPDCISRDLLNQGRFSNQRIRELSRELVEAGVKAVILIGGGEPLAHPDIGWVIDYLGQNGVQLGLTTNGLLIKPHLSSIAKYFKWTRISVDAGTSETFQRIRPDRSGKSQFNRVLENCEALAKVKQGTLGFSFMLYTEGKFDPAARAAETGGGLGFTNVHEIFTAAKLAKSLGCDYFEIKPMYDIHHFSILQQKELMEIAKSEIAKCLEIQTESFRILHALKLKHVLNCEDNTEPKEYKRCAVSQLRTLLTPSGAYVCPYFRGNASKKIGDATTTPFAELWHGPEREAVMSKLDPSVDCRMQCIRHDSNLILEEMIRGAVPAGSIEDFDFFL